MPSYRLDRVVEHPIRSVFDWHLRPGALERFIPPWGDVSVVHREGGLADGGTVTLKVRRGPISVDWTVRHTDYRYPVLFRDEQVGSFPMTRWAHDHRFEDLGDGRTRVVDEVEYDPPAGGFGRLVSGLVFEAELDRMFRFRQARLAADLELHSRYPGAPMTVAVTGASGLVGGPLTHFLRTGGHEVRRLVRRPAKEPDEVFWSPAEGVVDEAGLEGVDAFVHLAGEPIAQRWTDDAKRRILESREKGTSLLARTAAAMRPRPRVFVTASAIGYYGNRGDEPVDESDRPGKGFAAHVAQKWEAAAVPAMRAGIRTVALRSGVVLSPAGGALGKLLTPFKMGVGGRVGSGRQYFSWVDADDTLGLILHALRTETLKGPLNATAPLPVTNSTLAGTLGRVLGRPTVVPIPRLALRAVFGEMADTLLEGARVVPTKAAATGYEFLRPDLEGSLRFQLGIVDD